MTPQGTIILFYFIFFGLHTCWAAPFISTISEAASDHSPLWSMSNVAAGLIDAQKPWLNGGTSQQRTYSKCFAFFSSLHLLPSQMHLGSCFCKQTIIRSSGIRRESFIKNLTIISTETCDCGKEFTWTAFKFLWSCLFCSPWKHTISTSPLW